MVYVLSIDGRPLMPCTPAKARHLLGQGKAIVAKTFSRDVFVIKLTFDVTGYKEDITLGVDAGSKTIGLSASSERREYFAAEVVVRNDVTKLLAARREARRTRRSRLRYRAPRFDNRIHSKNKGWLAPSVENRISTHIRMVGFVCSILPIGRIVMETASFDIQKIGNPEIEGKGYQRGVQLGFWNVREYVLWRDGHKCRNCGGKTKDDVLEVHHLIQRKDCGSDRPDNLITLCKTCHDACHKGAVKLNVGKPGGGYRHEAFMDIMRWTTYNRLKALYGDRVSMTYGYITKNTRITHDLEKSHRIDALCIARHPEARRLPEVLCFKKVRSHNRRLYKSNILKGCRLKANQAPRFVFGFKLWDKVLFDGRTCFIAGRRSSGAFAIKTLEGDRISDSVPYRKLRLVEPAGTILTERRRPDSSHA